jgi:hypothetical protein
MRNNIKRAMLSLLAIIVVTTVGADTQCYRKGNQKVACPNGTIGSPLSTVLWGTVDHDSPQACTTIDEVAWHCVGGGVGYTYPSNYQLSFTCDFGACY